MMAAKHITWRTRLLLFVVLMGLFVGLSPWPFSPPTVLAAQLEPRSIRLSNSNGGTINVLYNLATRVATTGLIGSISIEFCGNSPLIGEVCTPPVGFDATVAGLPSQAGVTGFVVSTTSTINNILLTRPPAVANAGVNATYVLAGITNPTNGPLYARIQTFSTSDGTGPSMDDGGLAIDISHTVTVITEVPPYLTMCIGENITNFDCNTANEAFSDLGNLDPLVTSAAQHQIVIATNAENGYTMWVNGPTMMSGNNVIPPMTGGASQKGAPQFGLNMRANTTPQVGQEPNGPGAGTVDPVYNVPNNFRFQSGDAVTTATTPADFRKYTVSYIVNVAANQPGGVYATTLTYVSLANF